MPKLTNTQLLILSKASQRNDRAIEFPLNVKGSVGKITTSLIKRGLAEEVPAAAGMPIWQQGEDRPTALVVTSAGIEALGIEAGSADERPTPTEAASPGDAGLDTASPHESPDGSTADAPAPRRVTKLATLIDMLRRDEGASIADIIAVTDWLPHTTRAALTGLRERGFELSKQQQKGKPTIYRIVAADSGTVVDEGDALIGAENPVEA